MEFKPQIGRQVQFRPKLKNRAVDGFLMAGRKNIQTWKWVLHVAEHLAIFFEDFSFGVSETVLGKKKRKVGRTWKKMKKEENFFKIISFWAFSCSKLGDRIAFWRFLDFVDGFGPEKLLSPKWATKVRFGVLFKNVGQQFWNPNFAEFLQIFKNFNIFKFFKLTHFWKPKRETKVIFGNYWKGCFVEKKHFWKPKWRNFFVFLKKSCIILKNRNSYEKVNKFWQKKKSWWCQQNFGLIG